MRGVHTVAEVRSAEDSLMERVGDGALMQRAATGLAVHCARLLGTVYGARVTLLVGAGNNGGDALYAGAQLARRGARVTAVLLSPERAHPGGLAALRSAGGVVGDLPSECDLVVDGILGIGGKGGLRDDAASLAAAVTDSLTVAVDLPSGVDADTGAVPGASIRADVTVTFGALKAGLVVGRGAQRAGEVRLVDIGLREFLPPATTRVVEESDVRSVLPVPDATSDKYTRGVVGVLAGSPQYGGAAVLCTGSALCGGAGMVRYAGRVPDAIRARYPEVVVQEGDPRELRVQAWVVGPGFGTDDEARRLLTAVLSTEVPVIVDADAITLVASDQSLVRGRTAPTVLTPHDREFERVAGDVGDDRVAAARRAAADLGVTMLLKGDATVVADPAGSAFVNPTGTPWLATAGSGDVLSGLIGSLLASGLAAPTAAAVGAYVHGLAGQLAAASGPVTAEDVLGRLRAAFRALTTA